MGRKYGGREKSSRLFSATQLLIRTYYTHREHIKARGEKSRCCGRHNISCQDCKLFSISSLKKTSLWRFGCLPWPMWLRWGSRLGERGSAKSSLPPSAEEEHTEKDREWARWWWWWWQRGEDVRISSKATSSSPISQMWDLRTPRRLLTHRPSTPFLLGPKRPLIVAREERAAELHFFRLHMFRLNSQWASISRQAQSW